MIIDDLKLYDKLISLDNNKLRAIYFDILENYNDNHRLYLDEFIELNYISDILIGRGIEVIIDEYSNVYVLEVNERMIGDDIKKTYG